MPDHPIVVDQLGVVAVCLSPGIILEVERAWGKLLLREDADLATQKREGIRMIWNKGKTPPTTQ
jgi:hypothetical protein